MESEVEEVMDRVRTDELSGCWVRLRTSSVDVEAIFAPFRDLGRRCPPRRCPPPVDEALPLSTSSVEVAERSRKQVQEGGQAKVEVEVVGRVDFWLWKRPKTVWTPRRRAHVTWSRPFPLHFRLLCLGPRHSNKTSHCMFKTTPTSKAACWSIRRSRS